MRVPSVVSDLRQALRGPSPALPRWLDRTAAAWADLDGRSRFAVRTIAVVVAFVLAANWSTGVRNQWGGAPVSVWVASATLSPGELPTGLISQRMPPTVIPADAVFEVSDQPLAFVLPEGAILTSRHLQPRGPAAGLRPGIRAVPIPVEAGWGVQAGGWVDVWVLGSSDGAADLVAKRCAVLAVSAANTASSGSLSALVAIPEQAVAATARGLALGRVLLAHAPPPR